MKAQPPRRPPPKAAKAAISKGAKSAAAKPKPKKDSNNVAQRATWLEALPAECGRPKDDVTNSWRMREPDGTVGIEVNINAAKKPHFYVHGTDSKRKQFTWSHFPTVMAEWAAAKEAAGVTGALKPVAAMQPRKGKAKARVEVIEVDANAADDRGEQAGSTASTPSEGAEERSNRK